MAYDADAAIDLELERLRSKRHLRYAERMSSKVIHVLPAIKMVIGDWYVDEPRHADAEKSRRAIRKDLRLTFRGPKPLGEWQP